MSNEKVLFVIFKVCFLLLTLHVTLHLIDYWVMLSHASGCGGSVNYYPIPGDNSNGVSPVGVALSRHYACSNGIEAHSYLLSSIRSAMFKGTVSSSPVGVFDSRRNFIIIIKKVWQCKAEREWCILYQSEDPSPTIPTYRQKEEKEKKSRRL